MMKKVNREGQMQTSFSRSKTLSQIDVYNGLLEEKQHQSPAKPDGIEFLIEPKETELAKQRHNINTMHAI